MAMCPLLAKECIREQCAWWWAFKAKLNPEAGECYVAMLPSMFNAVKRVLYETAGYDTDFNNIR